MMIMNTCSQVVSFARELEGKSSDFYRMLSEKFPRGREEFPSFARENGEYVEQIERAYYGVITDAIEGCFTFDIDPEKYAFQTELMGNISASEILAKALEIEDKITRFYTDAAQQSKSLLADVPRVFKLVARKRNTRPSKLKSILGDQCGK